MNYEVVDKSRYYRAGVYHHFTKDCKCSVSITKQLDVTNIVRYSKTANTKFYINFLYVLSKTLNAREDYKMDYLQEIDAPILFHEIHPCHYIFHEDTETCTPVYSKYYDDYHQFYKMCKTDIEQAKLNKEYGLDMEHHPNWFDASYIS